MKTTTTTLFAAVFLFAFAAPSAAAEPAAPSPSQEFIELRDTKCTLCHTAERFEKKNFTEEEWNAILDSMIGKGLKLDANELEVLRHGGWTK